MSEDAYAVAHDAHARARESQLMEPTEDAPGSGPPPEVRTPDGREIRPSSADPIDRSDRHASSVLELPITWLDLTPPSRRLHLKVMEARDVHRVDLWSSEMSTEEQMAWASSQGGWTIRGEHHARSFVVSFNVDAPSTGLSWLAKLSSYQRLDLHPGGKVHLHLSGPWRDLLEVHRRLRQATDVKFVRVVDGQAGGMPDRRPPLTTAQ